MSNILSSSLSSFRSPRPGKIPMVSTILAAWFALVALLGMDEAFVAPPGEPPLSILFGVLAPLLLFFAGYRWSDRFRNFVLKADLAIISAVQSWRFVGFGFLALYAYRLLPGIFAWPAGVGDILIAFFAPWIALILARQPNYAASNRFRIWNLLGILDLVIAVGIGAFSSTLAVAGEITARPMAQMPLVLIPGFFVPLFVMLHTTALLQAHRHRVNERDREI